MTVAIAAIVLGIGIPSLQTMIQDSRKTSAINDLRTAMALARSTAINRRERVTVCKSTDGENCAEDNDWSQGWMVYMDPDNAGTRDEDEEILRVHEAIRGGNFSGNAQVANRVSFTPKGMASGTLGTITYADSRGSEHEGRLIISFGGQVRYEEGNNTN